MYFTKKMIITLTLAFSMTLCPLAYATSSESSPTGPLAINYTLEQVERKLEKDCDKQFKVHWDFEIVYHDDQVFIEMEYDKDDAKIFSKVSNEALHSFIMDIVKKITNGLKRDVIITGSIIEDNAQKPTYTFIYKDSNLNIK